MVKNVVTRPEPLSNAIGSFPKKFKMGEIFDKYRIPLAMISLVHERGARKYECYSWLNNPDASNSTVMENLDAIARHFNAHTMGKLIDVEGLPHIFHIACRAGMMISTAYRSINKNHHRLNDPRPQLAELMKSDEFGPLMGHQITSEEILVLTKDDMYPTIPSDSATLQSYIQAILIELAMYEKQGKISYIFLDKDVFEGKWMLDLLFLALIRYAELIWKEKDFLPLLNKEIFTEEDITFMEKYIIGGPWI